MPDSGVECELDHVIICVQGLDRALRDLRTSHRVEAERGGRHPHLGTTNALFSMGTSYFELLSADRPLAISHEMSFEHYAVRPDNIEAMAERADRLGLGPSLYSSRRETPAGNVLEWRGLDLLDHPFGGALPFFIEWGDTPQPSATLPLAAFDPVVDVMHPDAGELNALFTELGIGLQARSGPQARLNFGARTTAGRLELTGGARGYRAMLGI